MSHGAATLGGTSGDERRARFLELAHKLGQLGDQCHETRRALHDLALEGAADGSDQNELTSTAELDDWSVIHPPATAAPRKLSRWERAFRKLFDLE